MTFVVLIGTNAAPQTAPTPTSPIDDKSVLKQNSDDFILTSPPRSFRLQFGGISGSFNDNKETDWHYLIGISRRTEYAFERSFVWGAAVVSNESVELKLQTDLTSLFLVDPLWNDYGVGFSHFIWGQDGVSNLVNINQSKFSLYADLGTYFQFQIYYGLKGLAYSISFQFWF